MKFGGRTMQASDEKMERLSMLLWGRSGCGKTTLAETAPGDILWLNFDPDGTASLQRHRGKIHVLDFSKEKDDIADQFKDANSGAITAIEKMLREHEEIKTVVFDSLTTFGDKALVQGIALASRTTKGKSSTLMDPGFAGYGGKNTLVQYAVKNMLEMTGRVKRNMIFTAHEDKPDKNEDGVVVAVSIMLGSSLVEQVPVRISEIWHVSDTGKERRIAIRPCRSRTPMRTRMFETNKEPEFVWKYDADADKGERIEDWYNRWRDNGFKKIALPKA